MIWGVIGFFLGFAVGKNNQSDYPKELEHANELIKRQDEDLAYYKKLTKGLVEENLKLRKE
jgi:hypothetical protein